MTIPQKGSLFRTPLTPRFEPATRRVRSEHFTTMPRGSSYAKVLANKLNSPSSSDCASPVNYLTAKSETRRKESGGTLRGRGIWSSCPLAGFHLGIKIFRVAQRHHCRLLRLSNTLARGRLSSSSSSSLPPTTLVPSALCGAPAVFYPGTSPLDRGIHAFYVYTLTPCLRKRTIRNATRRTDGECCFGRFICRLVS